MLAVVLRQFGIDEVPLGLERGEQDGVTRFVGRRFKLIKGRLGL